MPVLWLKATSQNAVQVGPVDGERFTVSAEWVQVEVLQHGVTVVPDPAALVDEAEPAQFFSQPEGTQQSGRVDGERQARTDWPSLLATLDQIELKLAFRQALRERSSANARTDDQYPWGHARCTSACQWNCRTS